MKSYLNTPTDKERRNRLQRPGIWRSLVSNMDDGTHGTPDYVPPTTFLGLRLPAWIHGSVAWLVICWWCRNPAHDFTFYWIGSVGLPVMVTGKDPEHVFALDAEGKERGGWNYGWSKVVKPTQPLSYGWPKPFVSYAGSRLVYVGWRFPDGALGFKFRKNSDG